MPTLSFRNLLGFSRNQHSRKAEAEMMAKKIVSDLIKVSIEQILFSCKTRHRDYGPDSMPLTFFEQGIYKKCKERSDGIDISKLAALEKILRIEILKRLPADFQPSQKAEFQNMLTTILHEDVCNDGMIREKKLRLKIQAASMLSSERIIGYFIVEPDAIEIGNCIQYAVRKINEKQTSLPTTPRSGVISQDLSVAQRISSDAGSSIITLGIDATSAASSAAVSASVISGETGTAKEGSDRLSDGSLILQEELIKKGSVKEEDTPPRVSTPTTMRFN